jgi:hypothetical protein
VASLTAQQWRVDAQKTNEPFPTTATYLIESMSERMAGTEFCFVLFSLS